MMKIKGNDGYYAKMISFLLRIFLLGKDWSEAKSHSYIQCTEQIGISI